MRDAVPAIWIRYNRDLEGIITSMYADDLGLVTTGMGNLIDPIDLAITLPWKLPGGIPAAAPVIQRAWHAVKNDPKCAKSGWKYASQIPANNVRLDIADVEDLIEKKLQQHDMFIASRFPDWEARPADAQLAVHSMAWAMGPAFFRKFPKFTLAFGKGDYATCASECKISPEHGTIVERNRRNKALFLAAAAGGDPESVSWRPTAA
jgi:GH24 family phage-related lysozyme (muramidase)